jgi:hypothetical protein
MVRGIARWSLITVTLLLIGPAALAQTEPTTTQPVPWNQAVRFRMDCGQDLHRFCYGVQPGEGRLIQCLLSNRDQLSPACISRVAAARPTLVPPSQNAQSPGLPSANLSTGHAVTASALRASCGPDAQKLCAGVSGEIGGVVKCLGSHRVELSPTCDAFFKEMLVRRAAQKGAPKARTPTANGPVTTPAATNSDADIAAPSAAQSLPANGPAPSIANGPAETGAPSASNGPNDITDTAAPSIANGPADIGAPSAANRPAAMPAAPNGAAETGALSAVGNPATMPAAANGAADTLAPAVNGSATTNAPPAGNATAATGATPAAKSRPAKGTLDFPL